jgi:hypothetical protein
MKKLREDLWKKIRILFPLILAVYPLRHIWLGVELTDSAYSAGNYLSLKQMNPMWLFSTYLANQTGNFLSHLPFGHSMMGLNFYTALSISLTAVFLYFFLIRSTRISPEEAFLGELLAISLCWCPTTILYNYLTYLLFNAAAALLYLGLTKERRLFLFLAGILLGWNVFVRFPNILETLLILPLWYYAWRVHKRLKDTVQETLLCILGFLTGAGMILLQISFRYGLGAYFSAIRDLLNMPSDASDYSLTSMILTPLLDYKASARWLCFMALWILAGTLLLLIVRTWGRALVKVVFLAGIAGLFLWWYKIGVYNLHYYTYECMFQWIAVFLIITMIFCIFDLISGHVERNQKLMALMVLIILAVTPMGSNNHLYPNINNMFFVFPYTLTRIWQLFTGRWLKDEYEEGILSAPFFCIYKSPELDTFPVKAMLLAFLLAVCVQSIGFGAVFTFRDGMSGQKRDTRIENNAILKGMVTNKELAGGIEGLTQYISSEHLQSQQLLLYGQIPATTYFLNMEPAISTSWPDLRSYNIGIFSSDLEKIKGRPVVIISAKLDAYLSDDAEGMEITGLSQAEKKTYEADEKLKLLWNYMQKNGYSEKYTNTVFAVFD